jgi:hypothetical protein
VAEEKAKVWHIDDDRFPPTFQHDGKSYVLSSNLIVAHAACTDDRNSEMLSAVFLKMVAPGDEVGLYSPMPLDQFDLWVEELIKIRGRLMAEEAKRKGSVN